MKRTIIYSILASMMLLASCRKGDNPKVPALTRVPVPNLIKDATANQAISALSPAASAAFAGKFTVNLKFPDDVKPSKMDVVVRKNGNNSNVKIWQANVTTWPTTISVGGAQLISMFGTILLGDNYDFGVDIYTQDGQKFEAFPALGAAYGSGVASEYGGVTPVVTYSAICPYDPAIYSGNFVVVQDDWADFFPGDIITLTTVDATHFSFIDPFVRNPVALKVTVNPLSNSVSVPRQQIGTSWVYSANPATYPNPTIQSGAGTNLVAPCDQTVTMSLDYGVNGVASTSIFGGGPYILKLKKQ